MEKYKEYYALVIPVAACCDRLVVWRVFLLGKNRDKHGTDLYGYNSCTSTLPKIEKSLFKKECTSIPYNAHRLFFPKVNPGQSSVRKGVIGNPSRLYILQTGLVAQA